LNKKTGNQSDKGYRLPTEAEWEYAARGGQNYTYASSNTIGDVAWYAENYKNSKHGSQGTTHPVGTLKPNGYGIYDMSGNVWEWCEDWYDAYSKDSPDNPKGAVMGSNRVIRGGGWYNNSEYCRIASRDSYTPTYRGNNLGFRVAFSQLKNNDSSPFVEQILIPALCLQRQIVFSNTL
jgi:formylglycine-generating enzyme required for sulfatase activity